MIGRRSVLAAAVAGLGSAVLGRAARARAQPSRAEDIDVLVIGTGYAGAVTALRLAESGRSAVVLERGRRWRITPAGNTFATMRNPDGRALWLRRSSPAIPGDVPLYPGVLETFVADPLICFAGAGVGGGSLVNNALIMEPAQAQFQNCFGGSLDYAEMHRNWYPRARALIGGGRIPDDVLASAAYTDARDFQATAAAAGFQTERADMAVDWNIVRNELRGTAVPSAILGDCQFGINSGAKLSVDQTILASAERTGRIDVRPLHQVTDLRREGDRFVVRVRRLTEDGTSAGESTIRARTVFLAAGSLGTTALLLRARHTGGLPGLSSAIGSRWGTSGDYLMASLRIPPVTGAQGGPAHIIAKDWSDPKRSVTLCRFPSGVTVAGASMPTMLAVLDPPPTGFLRYDEPLGVSATWPSGPTTALTGDVMRRAAARLDATSKSVSITASTPVATSHSLGGVPLGLATDGYGRVAGQDGLYVVDSSLLPGSAGAATPALTVTALADRCVTEILDRMR